MLNKLKEKFRKTNTSDTIDRIEVNRTTVERIAVEVDEVTKNLMSSNQDLLNKLQNGMGH